MRRAVLASLLILLFGSEQSVFAEWAYRFVVYADKIYEVTEEQVLPQQIDKKVGEVTRYSTKEGSYPGHFSNAFPQGTDYYSIRDTSITAAIAVQVSEGVYIKAINRGTYDRGLLYNQRRTWILGLGGLAAILLVAVVVKRRKK